jgi:hypothetical protein
MWSCPIRCVPSSAKRFSTLDLQIKSGKDLRARYAVGDITEFNRLDLAVVGLHVRPAYRSSPGRASGLIWGKPLNAGNDPILPRLPDHLLGRESCDITSRKFAKGSIATACTSTV